MRKMKAKVRKLFQTLKLLNHFKSVYHGWKDRGMLTPSQNFGLCTCTKFRCCRFLYLIFGKSILLAKNSFFSKTWYHFRQCHGSRKTVLTLKNNIFVKIWQCKVNKSLSFTIFIFSIIWTLDYPDYFVWSQ